MSFTKLNKGPVLAGTLLVGLALWGCGETLGITGLSGAGDPIQFSREITLGDFQDALSGGTTRVEIELIGDGLVAHRVVLGHPEAKQEEEEIRSRVTDMQVVGDDGSLTLMLGALNVTFGRETRFRIGDDELGFDGFIDRVEAARAEGLEPWVKAERLAPDQPQDPQTSAFHASGLVLMGEGESHEIEINIDADNLQLNPDPQDGEPDGWINLLGLAIELRVSDGVTELATEEANVSDNVEFEGVVHSVDPEAGTFTFTDGTLVKVVDRTLILETEFDTQLLSLRAVQAALDEGHEVVAWGGGELESKEPRVIVALELRFAVRGEGGDHGEYVEFEGHVTSVDIVNQSFELTNGTIIKITEHTELITQGAGESLGSLAEVQAALDADRDVIAYGAGEVESVEPLTIIACEMRFVLNNSGGTVEQFEGHVDVVDLEGLGSFTLTNGTVVHMLDGTIINQAEQGESLMSLAAVQEALGSGRDVIAWGEGELEGSEPPTIGALKVWFVLAN